MASHLTFTATQAEKLSKEIPDILLAVRAGIANGAGFPIDVTTIRVRQRELNKAVHDRVASRIPNDAASVAAIVASNPDLLESYTDENGSKSILEEVREAAIEKIVGLVGGEMHRAISSQYADADFASVIEEIRSTLPALAELDATLADKMEHECASQLSMKVPTGRALLGTINRAREALAHAGRSGDTPKLVHARKLMEIADLIDMKGYQLDKTHVPPTAPSP